MMNEASKYSKYKRTKKGVLTNMFAGQRHRVGTSYSLSEFHDRFLNDKRFNRIHCEWVKSGYKKDLAPSVDRIYCMRGYTLRNIHIMTWAENRYKQRMELKLIHGKTLYKKTDGCVVKKYSGLQFAAIDSRIDASNICKVLNGRRKTAGGYEWSY